MFDFITPVAQKLMDRSIFTKISGLVDGCKGFFTSFSVFRFLKARNRQMTSTYLYT